MELYQEAINDIQFALSLNYPKASKQKVYERLARCHLALEQGEKARTALMILKQLVKDSVENKAEKGQSKPTLEENIDCLIESAEKMIR